MTESQSGPRLQPELAAELDRFRRVRARTLEMVRDLSQEQSDFSPSGKEWSVGQNLNHLWLAEKLYRDQFRRLIDLQRAGRRPSIYLSLREVNTSFAFIPREIIPLFELPLITFNLFVPRIVRETMVRFPLLSAKNPSVSEPEKGLPVHELRTALETSLEETEQLFRNNPGIDPTRMTITHPILGSNNIPQILRIVAPHEERHQGQIARVMRDARYPGKGSGAREIA